MLLSNYRHATENKTPVKLEHSDRPYSISEACCYSIKRKSSVHNCRCYLLFYLCILKITDAIAFEFMLSLKILLLNVQNNVCEIIVRYSQGFRYCFTTKCQSTNRKLTDELRFFLVEE